MFSAGEARLAKFDGDKIKHATTSYSIFHVDLSTSEAAIYKRYSKVPQEFHTCPVIALRRSGSLSKRKSRVVHIAHFCIHFTS